MTETALAGSVSAVLPLSLLEAVRAHDRPGEILEDEDLTVSLPRRLGLTGVVENQIARYETARKSGRPVSMEEFVSLTKLVLKRPDAEAIMRDTGQRMAQEHFSRVSQGYLKMLRMLPRGMLVRAWRRSARRLLRQMTGEARIDVVGRPPSARMNPNALAALDTTSTACALYLAALERLGDLFTGDSTRAEHSRCTLSGHAFCEWTVHGL
jgi:hypothetical protein